MDESANLGDLDGESFGRVAIRITGRGSLSRVPAEGEKLRVVIEGTVKFSGARRVDDVLVRDHTLTISQFEEPGGELADEVSTWLVKLEDERAGQPTLDDAVGDDEPENPEGA